METPEIIYRNPIEKIEKAMVKFGETKVLDSSWKLKLQNAMKKAGKLIPYDAVSETFKITEDFLLYPEYLKEKNMECVYGTDLEDFFARSVEICSDRIMLVCRVLFLLSAEKQQLREKANQTERIENFKKSEVPKNVIDREIKILSTIKEVFETYPIAFDWEPSQNKSAFSKYWDKYEAPETKQLFEQFKKKGHTLEYLRNICDFEMNMFRYLKEAYESMFNCVWQPMENKAKQAKYADTKTILEEIDEEIKKTRDKIRNLKSSKADKSIIHQEVKVLLDLKRNYNTVSGKDWKPTDPKDVNTESDTELEDEVISKVRRITKVINDEISNRDEIIRKKLEADKYVVVQEERFVFRLQEDNRRAILELFEPTYIKVSTESNIKPENEEVSKAEKISEEIKKQGDKVRNLKSSKAEKSVIDQEVKVLLNLKNDYKNITGQDWEPANSEATSKKKKQDSSKPGKSSEKEVAKNANSKDADTNKPRTRLGLEATKKENFVDWYSQVITKSGMIEYYDVSGCYILRPWSFAIWKEIKNFIDKEITVLGVQECYFPIFVTRSVLEKEKAHIADFAPEVAWVTKYGDSNLAEPIAIRPTSETVMYPAYAKWLKSDTELPLKLNQWNNVVVSAVMD